MAASARADRGSAVKVQGGSRGQRRRAATPPPVPPLPPAEARLRRVQRGLLLSAAVVPAVLFSRFSVSAFFLPKALSLWLLAGLLVAVALGGVALTRRVTLSHPWMAGALALFVLGLLLATATSGAPLRSIIGSYDRHTGLASYLAGVVLLVTGATVLRARDPNAPIGEHPAASLVRVLLATSAVVTFYGALQAIDADPLEWARPVTGSQVYAMFGNRNFLAGWLAITGVLALWGVVTRTWGDGWKVASGLLAAFSLLILLATTSFQGPAAWLAGVAVFAAIVVTGQPPLRRWFAQRAPLLGAIAVVGLLVGVLLITGPLSGIGDEIGISYRDRVTLSQSAFSMGAERPLTGVGLDLFSDHYHEHRPLRRAVILGVQPAADNAHNVPLQLFAGGGVLLLLGWVAWAVVTAAVLLRGLRAVTGERRLLLGALGGAWVAYLVQAIVSIDVTPLLATGWLLSGAILAVAPPGRSWTRRVPAAAAFAVAGLAVPLLLVGLWAWSLPARADLVGITAARGVGFEVETSAERAMALAPWEPAYPLTFARRANELGQDERAVDLYAEAVRRNPRFALAYSEAARVLNSMERPETTMAYWEQVVALAPTTTQAIEEAARYFQGIGQTERAEELFAQAQAVHDAVGQ